MLEQELIYPAGDVTAHGYLALPETKTARPGILLAPEGPGLGVHAKMRAKCLARLGFVVLAMDPYGGGHVAASHEETMSLVSALVEDRPKLLARTRGALAALADHPAVDRDRVVAIGYCFGGLAVLDLGRSGAPIVGVATFHGLLDAPAQPLAPFGTAVSARLLIFTGAADHLVPLEQLLAFTQEMQLANADWQINLYGGARHAFTNLIDAEKLAPLGFGYDHDADVRSWAALLQFLGETLETPTVESRT